MKENTNGKNLDALNAGVAESREEIAALAAGFKKLTDSERPQEGPANGDQRHGGWTGFWHGLDEAGERGGKVVKGIADEIERHPLIGGMAAFGLGYVIARLLYRRNKKDHRP